MELSHIFSKLIHMVRLINNKTLLERVTFDSNKTDKLMVLVFVHHCSFLVGKSCLAPLKQMSIPRLELAAATVAVRLNKLLKNDLEILIDKITFWTDSITVLC